MTTRKRPSTELKRRLLLRELRRMACPVIEAKGFEATTVEDLAATLGISRRTFFRYFPVKEDVVVGEFAEIGASMARHLEAGSAVPAVGLGSLEEAMVDAVAQNAFFAPDGRTLFRMVFDVASLRSRFIASLETSAEALARALSTRSPGAEGSLLSRLSMTILTEATERWSRGSDDPIEAHVRRVFEEVYSLTRRIS